MNIGEERNWYREALVDELRSLSKRKMLTEERRKQEAVRQLDSIVANMQERYASVLGEYVILKSEFI